MARQFDGADQYLNIASAVVTVAPLTFAGWFNSAVDTTEQYVVTLGDTAGNSDEFALGLNGDAGNPVDWGVRRAATRHAVTSSGYTANAWHHAIGLEIAVDDHRAYIDGGSEGTDGVSSTPAGLDTTRIGSRTRNTPGDYFSGAIAEVAIWNVAISAAELSILAAGYSPLFVHPQNLVAYWPLLRNDNDVVGGYDMTPINAPTWAAHPPIIYPAPPFIPFPSAVAPGGLSIPVAMRTYRNLRL